MSALAREYPVNRSTVGQVRQLRALQSVRAANPRIAVSLTIVIGGALILFFGLLLSVLTAQSVYEISALKSQKTELALKTQIIEQQVNSLSSSQNLADAAHVLGMVANANPVFLNVTKQEVYGKPMAAISNPPQDRVAGNLVANSAMVTKTTAKALKQAIAAKEAKATTVAKSASPTSSNTAASVGAGSAIPAPVWNAAKGNVAGAKTASTQVGLPSGGIPVSPTH